MPHRVLEQHATCSMLRNTQVTGHIYAVQISNEFKQKTYLFAADLISSAENRTAVWLWRLLLGGGR